MPIPVGLDRYEHIRDIGSGNFGVARLMRDKGKEPNELVAVKFIERGIRVGAAGCGCPARPQAADLPCTHGSGTWGHCGAKDVRASTTASAPPRECFHRDVHRLDGARARVPVATQVDKNVEREILNHRMLSHPNIISFKEVSR